MRAGRADVAIAAELVEEVLTIEVNAVDVDYLDVPSIDVALNGFTVPTLPNDCAPTDAGISCEMPVGLRAATDGQPPTESATWTIQLADTTPDDVSAVTIVATSGDNPLENDPDPTNNTITITDS